MLVVSIRLIYNPIIPAVASSAVNSIGSKRLHDFIVQLIPLN
jgi:hypothetical protein